MEKQDLIRGYATALFQIAAAEDDIERVSDELFRFSKAVEQSHELRATLTDLAIPLDRKRAIVSDLLGDRGSPHTRNILDFVISQGRGRELSKIVDSLADLAASEQQKVLAEVRSAVPLDDDQRKRLAEVLSKATGKIVDVKVLVDPHVVGGIYAKVGDRVIDATVRRRLQDLREQLAKVRD